MYVFRITYRDNTPERITKVAADICRVQDEHEWIEFFRESESMPVLLLRSSEVLSILRDEESGA